MKKLLFILLLFTSSRLLISQKIFDSIQFNCNVTGDFANNFKGGANTGSLYIGMEQLSLELNSESAGMWKHGLFFIHAINIHGAGPTEKLVGDLQGVSNIEAGDHTGIYEYYYSHDINKLTILLGQHDLNSEFVGTKYGENFINSSFGIIPSISLNVPVSIYPMAAPCILFRYNATEDFVIKFASYDGDPGSIADNKFNIHWHFDSEEGILNIAEMVYTFDKHIQNGIHTQFGIKMGTYKIGAFFHTGKFQDYSNNGKDKYGDYGFYFIADQMIIPKPSNPQEGLAAMLQLGYSPSNVNLISRYLGAGIRYHGIMPGRTRDFIGFAFTNATLQKDARSSDSTFLKYETSFEITYKFQFGGGRFSIQPNLQYVVNPGAIAGVNDSWLGILRFQLAF
jgi:porin